MRWTSFILSELLLLAGSLYGLSYFGGMRIFEASDAVAALERPWDSITVPNKFEAATATIRPAVSAVDTFLGMPDAHLRERMRSGVVKSLHFNRGGSSISFRVDFADGSRAAFKPLQTNPQTVPRKEAAAYRLSRLLGLNAVAPVIMRSFARDELLSKLLASNFTRDRVATETLFDERGETLGSLAYWIPTVVDLHLDTTEGVNQWTGWLGQSGEIPPEQAGLMAQLSTLLVFDLLQNNSDRFSGGNLLGSPDGKMLYYMDNAFGFQTDPDGHMRCWNYLRRAQKFSRSLVQAMQQLDRAKLQAALNGEPGTPLLSVEEQIALLSRRDAALAYMRELFREYGTERVLVFP